MNRVNRVLPAAMLLAVLSNPVKAEPSEAIKYLINEPASMLDLALYKLDRSLNGPNEKNLFTDADHAWGEVKYDWATNRIVLKRIVRYDYRDGKIIDVDLKKTCRQAISGLRSRLGIDWQSGEFYKLEHFYRFFGHSGYQRNRPVGFLDNLAAAIHLRAVVFAESRQECEAPLLGTKVLFPE
jgi:hypothetical protein